jgi:hypothetical protein
MVDIFDPACELLSPWRKEIYLCTVAPPQYLLSDLLPPFSKKMYSIYRQLCGWAGGGVLNCTVDHILQEFYTLVLTRFRTYKIVSPPKRKMTSKDDIKGLVSLKFLRPWVWQTFGSENWRTSCFTFCKLYSHIASRLKWRTKYTKNIKMPSAKKLTKKA